MSTLIAKIALKLPQHALSLKEPAFSRKKQQQWLITFNVNDCNPTEKFPDHLSYATTITDCLLTSQVLSTMLSLFKIFPASLIILARFPTFSGQEVKCQYFVLSTVIYEKKREGSSLCRFHSMGNKV